MIEGIDVAYYEPVIDWTKVIQNGYRFAFIKCSQALYNDPKFVEHWKNAKAAGMPRGAYHFYDVSASPEAQAEKFFSSLGNDLGELPFVVDFEKYIAGTYYGSENWYRYLNRLKQLSDHPIMIYTAYYYWTDNARKSPAVQDITYFRQFPLWIANYGVPGPAIPVPWTSWMFWQYSESGFVDGVTDTLGRPTKCDLDTFYGDEQQFQNLLNGIPPTGDNTVSTFYLAKGNATIRTGPSSSYPQVSAGEKYVLTGDIIESLEPQQNGWAKIANIYRNDVKMVVASPAWCTAAYLQVTDYTPTPPPTNDCGNDDVKVYVNDVLTVHIVGKIQ